MLAQGSSVAYIYIYIYIYVYICVFVFLACWLKVFRWHVYIRGFVFVAGAAATSPLHNAVCTREGFHFVSRRLF